MSTNLMMASRQWATRPDDQRFRSVAELKASVEARRTMSRTRDMRLGQLEVRAENDALLINGMEPSHWAFGQMLEERALECAAWADALEGVDISFDDAEEFEKPARDDDETEEDYEVRCSEEEQKHNDAEQEKLNERVQEIISELQSCSYNGS